MATVREEFEAWLQETFAVDLMGDELLDSVTQAWQAASKAMQERCAEVCDSVSRGELCVSGQAVDACIDAIRSINTNE